MVFKGTYISGEKGHRGFTDAAFEGCLSFNST